MILNCGYRGWQDPWVAARNDGGVPKALEELTLNYEYEDLNGLEDLPKKNSGKVAAVFACTRGRETAHEHLQAIHDLAAKHGALFVLDEVISGFRLATGGVQELYGIKPDLCCFAKAMANGMPVAAVAGRADIMKTMADLAITVTYGGEALSLAASVATMRKIKECNVCDHLWKIGQKMRDGIESAARTSARTAASPLRAVYVA